ncbi:hypothetical protein Nepgr_016692 [Nepenthes gracilis]|uniref:ornithine decarboxylase n=1 Tax=Nepenthes gracilis TaxID=150966 RepID=A0AAD3XSK6_NEPGR|nr:hypothetical protein Nepgr_016692 [Nepenthes gracilis]
MSVQRLQSFWSDDHGSLQTTISIRGEIDKNVTTHPDDSSFDFIHSIINGEQRETKEPFYVLDLGVIVRLMDGWTRAMPSIRPYYAVKCNPNHSFLAAMAALGANFDCASKSEIESVLSLGVSPDRIIFANPCKAESHIRYAASVGVNMTTFDSKYEIEKIRKWHPKCGLLLRVKAPDEGGSKMQLGVKYGALVYEVAPLLQTAHSAGLTVYGVSFHVGSAACHPEVYEAAVLMAKSVFDTAAQLGLPEMKTLDIGGGFMAEPEIFEAAASAVNSAVETYFSNVPNLTVIAEPGRYFAEPVFTLAVTVIGKRVRSDELREYWINDGIYGSLNGIIYDCRTVNPTPFAVTSQAGNPLCKGLPTYCSTVFGPTCDSLDTVMRGLELPDLEVNDWLVFGNMGAYTTAAGSEFNGFSTSAIRTYLLNPSTDREAFNLDADVANLIDRLSEAMQT